MVREIFRRYLACGSVVALKAALDGETVCLPDRIDGAGRETGGGLFSRGHLYKILSNPSNRPAPHKGQDIRHIAISSEDLGQNRPSSSPPPPPYPPLSTAAPLTRCSTSRPQITRAAPGPHLSPSFPPPPQGATNTRPLPPPPRPGPGATH